MEAVNEDMKVADVRGCRKQGYKEKVDSLWPPLKGKSQKRRSFN